MKIFRFKRAGTASASRAGPSPEARKDPAPLPTAATANSLPAFIQAWMKDAPPQWVAVEEDDLDALRQRADWPVLTARRKALRFYQAGSLVHLKGEGREEYAVDAGGALYPLDDAAQIIRANAAAGLLLTSHRKVTEYVRFYCNECPRTNDADGPFRLDELWTLVSREHRFDKQVLIRRFEDHSGFFMVQACIEQDGAQFHVLFLLHANGRMGLFAKKDFGLFEEH